MTHPVKHIHHDHNHNPGRPDTPPIIDRVWQLTAVLGNAVLGLAEVATSNLTTMSLVVDGGHNIADAYAYRLQTDNILGKKLSEERRARNRKITHWVISVGSLAVAAKAGMDIAAGNEAHSHAFAPYVAGASLLLSTYMGVRLYRGSRRKRLADPLATSTIDEKGLWKHLLRVDLPSAALAVAGVISQKYNVHLEQGLAVISGAYAAYTFRPTKTNLEEEQNCPLHHTLPGGAMHEHGYGQQEQGGCSEATDAVGHDHYRAPATLPRQSFMARWRVKREARRQADYDARWQAWLEKCAASQRPNDYYLSKWAHNLLSPSPVTIA